MSCLRREEVQCIFKEEMGKEIDYKLKKELWAFTENRIAVRFEYEWRTKREIVLEATK